jgi:exodeoxyribonuclease VII large subunit
LFPSILQGDKAVTGIIAQLERIKKVIHHFDAVAIIRGGGDVGLSCYNKYELAKAIALFPIPVITGIGHVTNETVCEMIAHTNAITPTCGIIFQNSIIFRYQFKSKEIIDKAVDGLSVKRIPR